jgi:hypothetical protein
MHIESTDPVEIAVCTYHDESILTEDEAEEMLYVLNARHPENTYIAIPVFTQRL